MKSQQFVQPELTDHFGVKFNGRAETATGDVWWYTNDEGKRYPLVPANPTTKSPVRRDTRTKESQL